MNRPRQENVPALVSFLLRRPVRWAPGVCYAGIYDGHKNTLEVFNVNSADQFFMMQKIRPERAVLEEAIGGALVLVFHTEERTRRIFPEGFPHTVMSGLYIDGNPSKAAITVDIVPFSDGDAPRPFINGARMHLLEKESSP